MDEDSPINATATLWLWRSPNPDTPAAWHFLTIEGPPSAELRYAALGRTGGFGSIKVKATIGTTSWRTSVFPHRESGGFMLPVKASVRKAEGIKSGDTVDVVLEVA
jgi:hypothetical protein